MKLPQFNWHWLVALLSLGIFGMALFGLSKIAKSINPGDVLAALHAISPWQLVLAGLVTVVAYLMLTCYDVLALRYMKVKVPYSKVALTSFTAYSVGHNVGLAALSGGSIRYRLYSLAGLNTSQIANVILLTSLTFTFGISAMLGIALAVEPGVLTELSMLSETELRASGVAILLALAGIMLWTGKNGRLITLRHWQLALPSGSMILQQIILVVLDIFVIVYMLHLLLPDSVQVTYTEILTAFVLSMVIGIISHVPGGLGVFEASMTLALPQVPQDIMLATLLVFRLFYYILPFLVTIVLLLVHEWGQHRSTVQSWGDKAQRWINRFFPQVLGTLVFMLGAFLLFSGSIPNDPARETLLGEFIPLSLIEASHLLASVTGFCLLILAHGLFNRLDGAWHITVWLLMLSAVTCLFKGLDYEIALLSLTMLALLWSGRRAFYRKTSLMAQAMTPEWLLLTGVIVGGSLWLGFFAFKHVEYRADLWWSFALDGNVSRFLRASVVLIVLGIGFALYRLLRPSCITPELPDQESLDKAAAILVHSQCAHAALVLLADKFILFSDSGRSFLMYQIQGKSWITMGDPVGDELDFEELLWTFREQCDLQGGQTVFYQVSTQWLPLYIDMGMALLKLGESALVELPNFTLEGKKQADLRQALSKGKRENLSFEVLSAEQLAPLLPELQQISENWMGSKNTREKSFSIGSFNTDYLHHFPCAVVRYEGKVVGFGNLWCSGQQQEVAIDLMRYHSDAPKGVMDYLFVESILWAKAQGYHWFNLGMSPLSGLEKHRLAPVWHQIGNLMFQHGEQFYNFEGLRRYKEKFNPVWQPSYLAVRSNLYAPRGLLDAAVLISGSLKGALKK